MLTYVILDLEFTLKSLNHEKSSNVEHIIICLLKSLEDSPSASNLMFGHLGRYFTKYSAYNGRLMERRLKFSIKTSCTRIYTSTTCQSTIQSILKRSFSQCLIKTKPPDQLQLKFFNRKISQNSAKISI